MLGGTESNQNMSLPLPSTTNSTPPPSLKCGITNSSLGYIREKKRRKKRRRRMKRGEMGRFLF